MALQFCMECGKQISDQATVCPHCGFPIQGKAAPQQQGQSPVVTVKKNSHPVLTFIGAAALVVVILIGALVLYAVLHKAPKFAITGSSSDAACTQLTDYCITVYCDYQNVGNGAGTKTVRAQLLDKNTQAVRADHFTSLTLSPQESQRMTFTFPEAELDWEVSYVCQVDPDK